jgi:hypothetical protein
MGRIIPPAHRRVRGEAHDAHCESEPHALKWSRLPVCKRSRNGAACQYARRADGQQVVKLSHRGCAPRRCVPVTVEPAKDRPGLRGTSATSVLAAVGRRQDDGQRLFRLAQ